MYLLQMHKVGIPSVEQRIFNSFLETALRLLEVLHGVRRRVDPHHIGCHIVPIHNRVHVKRHSSLAAGERASRTRDSVRQVLHPRVGRTYRHQKRLHHVDPEADVPISESAALVMCVRACVRAYVTIVSIPLCPQGHDGVVTLCRYPFVFDAQAKTTLLQTDAVIQMQVSFSLCSSLGPFWKRAQQLAPVVGFNLIVFHFVFYWQMAVDQAQMQNFNSMFLPAVESVNPCLILIVRRDNIVGDTMEVLRKSKNVDYKKPLKVKAAKICTYNK